MIWIRHSCIHHPCWYNNTSWGVVIPNRIILWIVFLKFKRGLLDSLIISQENCVKITDLLVNLFLLNACFHVCHNHCVSASLRIITAREQIWLIAWDFVVGSNIPALFFISYLMPGAQHGFCVPSAFLLQLATVTVVVTLAAKRCLLYYNKSKIWQSTIASFNINKTCTNLFLLQQRYGC